MKKGIIYTRVSTVSQEVNRQISELKDYARKNDIEIVEFFTDVTSGKTKAEKRTGAKDMFDFLENNKIDIVLVSEISRIGRSAIDVQKNISTIVETYNVNLYIHQQGLQAYNRDGKRNMAFKLVTDVLANVAQMEREQLSERTKSGLQQKKKEYEAHNKVKGLKEGDKGYKKLGRKVGTTKDSKTLLSENKNVVRELKNGMSIRKTAKLCDVSPATVQKVKKAMTA